MVKILKPKFSWRISCWSSSITECMSPSLICFYRTHVSDSPTDNPFNTKYSWGKMLWALNEMQPIAYFYIHTTKLFLLMMFAMLLWLSSWKTVLVYQIIIRSLLTQTIPPLKEFGGNGGVIMQFYLMHQLVNTFHVTWVNWKLYHIRWQLNWCPYSISTWVSADFSLPKF